VSVATKDRQPSRERRSPAAIRPSISEAQRNQIQDAVLDQYVSGEALVTRPMRSAIVSDQELLDDMSQVTIFRSTANRQGACVDGSEGAGPFDPRDRSLVQGDAKLRSSTRPCRCRGFATATEMKQFRALTKQQRELTWFRSRREIREPSDPTMPRARLITTRINRNGTPATVDLRYVEISLSQLASKVSVDDAQLKTYTMSRRSSAGAIYRTGAAPGQPYLLPVAIRKTTRRQGQAEGS